MQRGTRPNTTNASSVVARGDAGSSSRANTGFRFDGLESPGDASSPIGIQFTRGSFSDHLLPLESPASIRVDLRRRAIPANPTPSVLRSPPHKRPPPTPAAAPTPPRNIANRGVATASSIITPKNTGATPARITPRPLSSKETGAGTRLPTPTEPAPPLSADTPAMALLSVNPVDALVKKLRQQATELTQVYEQMEKKDTELNKLRDEIQQLHVDAERQRTRHRASVNSTAPRSGVRKPPVATTASTRAKSTQRLTREAVPSCSEKQQQPADTAIAKRRMEETLAELRQCHHELLGYCTTVDTEKTPLTPTDMQQEQQLYIRVLEDAVHLKASELCITGHEELLVVLAELRHTIYQQETEFGELQQKLQKLKSEHLECKTVWLDREDTLQKEKSTWEQERVAVRQREAALQRQLEDVQRLAHTEHMRFREARVTQDAQATRTTALEKELRSRTQEIRQWETTRSETWSKRESLMAKQMEDLKASLEAKRAEASQTKEALDTAQRHVDELKAMQDGFLQSIDQFVVKEDEYERRIQQLEGEVAAMKELRQESEALRVCKDELHQELEETRRKQTEQLPCLTMVGAIQQANEMIKDAQDATTVKANHVSEGSQDEDELSKLDFWTGVLRRVLPSISAAQPWVSTLVDELTACSTLARRVLGECKEECDQLRTSNAVFEASLETGTSELKRLQAELLQTQTEFIQSQVETQKLQLHVATMEEEARDAQAQLHLRETLADQIFEQENLLHTQQRRLEHALEQTNELMALETHLTNELLQKEHELSQLRKPVKDYADQQRVLQELEHELEEAASLAERQNAWNQQLTVELEHLELAKAEQDQLVETLVTRDEAVTSRFSTLFSQYRQFVAANKRRLHDEYAIANNQEKDQAVSVHDEELGTGDVLHMVRVFPTIVEEYLASVMLGVESGKPKDQGKRVKQRGQARQRSLVGESDTQPRLLKKPGAAIFVQQDEEEPLEEQLRDIAHAFNRFKSM